MNGQPLEQPTEPSPLDQVLQLRAQQQADIQQLEQLQAEMKVIKQEEERFWTTFNEHREGASYDCTVGEIQATPTYRLATLETLTRLMQQGVRIPPKIFRYFLDTSNDLKDMWEEEEANEAQSAMQMQQQQLQAQAGMEQLKGQIKIAVQELINEGKLEVEKLKQMGEREEE
jgi:hypothetical protein